MTYELRGDRRSLPLFFILFLLFITPAFSYADVTSFTERFTNLDRWQELQFAKIKPTNYKIVSEAEEYVLQAVSNQAASLFIFKQLVTLNDTSRLSWRWQIENIFPQADNKRKSGDDYPWRVYVAFLKPKQTKKVLESKYGKTFFKRIHSSLIYVWGNRYPKDSVQFSPYSRRRLRMIALESGDEWKSVWRSSVTSPLADYRRAFGKEPPSDKALIVVMSDTDNTLSNSTARMDDLQLTVGNENQD